jgi:putative membrane protein
VLYLVIKSLHVVSIISWMAGLLYLPRLFVYHAVQATGSPCSEMLKTMERRLFKFIMRPAMIVTWLTGLWLAYDSGFWREIWFAAKFTCVFLLTGAHEFLGAEQRRFEQGTALRDQKFYRIINEVPTMLMIFIVVFVIVKPFS